MKKLKKLSRGEMKSLNGGKWVFTGTYACCVGNQCSSTVRVEFADDLECGSGTSLTQVG